MKGRITQWRDDRGFGFISSEEVDSKVFFHISSLTTKAKRPEVGDSVIFITQTDSQNRLNATSVAIEGMDRAGSSHDNPSKVEPVSKNVFDYLFIAILLTSVALTGFAYFKTTSLESSIVFAIPAVIAFFFLSREKKPKSKSFQCAKCRRPELFNPRTIKAWNNGFIRLYCNSCHIEWLKNQPRREPAYRSRNNSGCFGSFVLIVGTLFVGGYSIINWLIQLNLIEMIGLGS
jgi:cold shock CspA family protein